MDGRGRSELEWEDMGDRGKACMDVNKDRTRNPNCLLGRLLFSCTGLTACFFIYLLKGPVCVCLLHGH